ncbi:MAG TPA: amidase [Chitinophagales bacterium]|nr:amidase [Chitinophagales bacterium]
MSKSIHAFQDDALGTMDATGIAEAIRTKKVSAEEVAKATIARLEKVNPVLDAVVLNTFDEALNIKGANENGAFYGVPTYVKDNDHIKGYPTQIGTKTFKAKPAAKNGIFVDLMQSTGLNIIGKSTMPEFGLNCSTENPKYNITRNPWSTDHTPGGSSSGSGALVASGVVAIAQANDGAGSTRIPAACCGLVGLKPSRDRLTNFEGSEFLPVNIGYQGVLTRSVRDTAMFYAEAEKFYKNSKLPAMGLVKDPLKRRIKVAIMENPAAGQAGSVDEDTYRVMMETVTLLESLGHEVEQIKIPVDMGDMMYHYLNYYGFLAFVQSKLGKILLKSSINQDDLEPFTYGLSNRFKKNILDFPKSVKILKTTVPELEKQIFDQFDILLTPITSIRTPEIGYLSPLLSSKEIVKRSSFYAPFPGMQNATGAPALALPMGRDSRGLPLGMQFSAKLGQDALLLELAFEIEAAQPWKHLYEM